VDQIISKNIEIEKLKKQNKELEKNYNQVKNENANYEKKNKQLEDIIDRLKAKYDALKEKKENEENKEQIKKVIIKKNKGFFKKNENRLLKSASDLYLKGLNRSQTMREILDDNFYHLLTDKEKECLKNLFGSNEEYISFCNKLNVINTRNIRVENQLK
jgi:chromosome segregation ATPase